MKNRWWIRTGTGFCIAAAIALFSGGVPEVQAAGPVLLSGAHTGIAGLSLYMDRFYENYETLTAMHLSVAEEGVETQSVGQVAETAEVSEQAPVSEYANVGISIANNYVNIRTEPNTDSEIVGKLYQGSAATITETVGDWVKITSGNAKGYIKAEYLAIGFDAEELVDKYGTRWAVVDTETLRVRMEATTDSRIATLVPMGERLLVTSVLDGWYEISIDGGDITGFVSADYVNMEVEFEHAITIEEEQAEIRRQQEAEEALRRQQEEQRRREEEQRKREEEAAGQQQQQQSSSSSSSTSTSTGTSSGSTSGLGAEIAAFAQKFVGNPYVWGGTSLTNGADCSGFVQSVYKSFGITIPRDSRSQCAGAGYKVSLDALQAGDLIFYTNSSGVVNHVAMYIGNGKVVHASDPRSGIIISTMRYRTPYMARRVVD